MYCKTSYSIAVYSDQRHGNHNAAIPMLPCRNLWLYFFQNASRIFCITPINIVYRVVWWKTFLIDFQILEISIAITLTHICSHACLPDIDECATSNGGCQQIYTNNLGSCTCSCWSGTISTDGHTCIPPVGNFSFKPVRILTVCWAMRSNLHYITTTTQNSWLIMIIFSVMCASVCLGVWTSCRSIYFSRLKRPEGNRCEN